MEWFGFGVDSLLRFIERRLKGILLTSIPVLGPSLQGDRAPLPPLEERFKLMAYCDDVKPTVSCMSEFFTIDKACTLFETSSGCRLHRDPAERKWKLERYVTAGRYSTSVHDAV